MATLENPCAASSLLVGLVDGPPVALTEVARTRVSVHYETAHPEVPVLSVCTPEAVHLPNGLVTSALPAPSAGSVVAGEGRLRAAEVTWRVRRWWRPARPRGLPRPSARALARLRDVLPVGFDPPRASYGALSPRDLIGAGPGLTPAGDDLLAGALVAAHATADSRLPSWVAMTRHELRPTRTTAVSRAMLHHALEGYATVQLADFVTALCRDEDLAAATDALLAVGHTSGAALLAGVLHTLTTHDLEGAA